MSHVVPILCLIFFILFIEAQTKQQTCKIEKEFEELKKRIEEKSKEIDKIKETLKSK